MAITLEQIETLLTTAWSALESGELQLESIGGQRALKFRTLEELRNYIDWLEGKKRQLQIVAGIDPDSGSVASGGSCPVVSFRQEGL